MKNMSLGGISTSWDKFLLTFVEVDVPKGSDFKELNVVPQKKKWSTVVRVEKGSVGEWI